MLKDTDMYYECNPYIPGTLADVGPSHAGSPLGYITSTLSTDLTNGSELVAPAGSKALEIGFVQPPGIKYHYHSHLTRALADIAGVHRMFGGILAGAKGYIEITDEEDRAYVRELFPEGTLPRVVIGHTTRAVADVAIRDFGFTEASPNLLVARPGLQEALGHEAVAVYMGMDYFLERYPHELRR